MRQLRQFCVVTLALLCFVPSLQAQGLGNQPAEVKTETELMVYPVRSGNAAVIAESL